jgi:hypothetical protein
VYEGDTDITPFPPEAKFFIRKVARLHPETGREDGEKVYARISPMLRPLGDLSFIPLPESLSYSIKTAQSSKSLLQALKNADCGSRSFFTLMAPLSTAVTAT